MSENTKTATAGILDWLRIQRLPGRMLRRLTDSPILRRLKDTRSRQLRDEVRFWRSWFSTQGLSWPEDYRRRFNPELPIQNHVARYIDQLSTEIVHILDVGSGPITKLGKTHHRKELVITATDLLAPQYDALLRELRVEPLVRTVFADAENLVAQFGESRFDIVHGQNSIDHTADPFKAIKEMIGVAKPAGFVVLYHAENEGENEGYNQLHKWDFTCEERHFVIRGPGPGGNRVDVTNLLAALGEVVCFIEDGAVLATIRKRPQLA